jgi:hypothetical protein
MDYIDNTRGKHVRTLEEHIRKLCETMCQSDHYVCKDGLFRLQTTGNYGITRMYIGNQSVGFKLDELRYLMNMLHLVGDQQTKVYSCSI